MIHCSLQKPESTFDQIRKNYNKLKPTDAALIATALVLSGRYAIAVYGNEKYHWPQNHENLTKALQKELSFIQHEESPAPKRSTKTVIEEEVPEITIGLVANYAAGEKFLGEREDLKTLFSDLLQKGVEYHYLSTDIGWQWALERANWSVLSGGEVARHVKFKVEFQDNSLGVLIDGAVAKKRTTRAKSASAEKATIEEDLSVFGKEELEELAEIEKIDTE